MMRFLANLTLGKKIALLTTLGLLVTVAVFGYLGLRAVNQATETMLEERMTTTRLVADHLDELLGYALSELENTAHDLTPDAPEELAVQISALEERFARLSIATQAFYIINTQGQIIWGWPEQPAREGKNISFYPSINQTLDSGKPTVSGLILDPSTGIPVVLLNSLIPGDNGYQGVLSAAIDLTHSSIGGVVRSISLGQTGYVEVVDQNGVVVARTDPGPRLEPFERSDHSGRFADLIAAGKPTRGLCHTCHVPVQRVEKRDVLAFVPLSRAQWGVVIRQSEEEAMAPVYELRQSLLIAGGVLIITVLMFVIIFTRNVISRVKSLTLASQRIARGDLISTINTAQRDEIGLLGQSLEDMRGKLKASYENLERRTSELASLLAVSEILTSLADLSNLDTALNSALNKTLEITGQESGGILLLNEEKKSLCYQVYRRLPEDYVQKCYQLGEGIPGKVAQSGKAIVLKNISSRSRSIDPELRAAGLHTLASFPLSSKKRVLGVLTVASRKAVRFSPDDLRLLEGIARQIATAVENARLHREVQQKDEIRGELLREIYSIQEEERRRISRELHDETSQVLASLNANLEAASRMLPVDEDKVRSLLKKAQSLSINILDETHRLIYELRPTLLDDMGLVPAVRWLVDNSLRVAGINIDYNVIGRGRRLPSQLETTLFRVSQEAIGNIIRHAHAKNASVELHFKKNAVRVQVKDDGVGFDVAEAIRGKERPRGLGLLGMRERVELFHGTFHINSQAGQGTEINIEIPTNDKEVDHAKDKNTDSG